jgi:protease-4
LPDALGALVGRALVGLVSQADRSLNGASVLWLGEHRF